LLQLPDGILEHFVYHRIVVEWFTISNIFFFQEGAAMKIKSILMYLWKLPLCGIVFFIGLALGGGLLAQIGFTAPAMPEGADANIIMVWYFAGSTLLALALSFVARRLRANLLVRWVILFELMWVFVVVGMVIESFFFMDTGAVSSWINSLYTMLSFLLPVLFLSALEAVLFRPAQSAKNCLKCMQSFFATRRLPAWLWRVAAALFAYPLAYFLFGLLVNPLISEYYMQGMYELTIPSWGELIPLQLVRSIIFLMASLPVVAWWRGSQRSLWVSLGVSIFVMTAFMAVITSYWFPWQMRLFHGLELLADAMVYAGALTVLFRPASAAQGEMVSQVGVRAVEMGV
jgi:hypothetical protein